MQIEQAEREDHYAERREQVLQLLTHMRPSDALEALGYALLHAKTGEELVPTLVGAIIGVAQRKPREYGN